MADSIASSFVKTGVIFIDRGRRIDFANRAALELFACTNADELATALDKIDLDDVLERATQEPREISTDADKIELQITQCERGWVILAHHATVRETLERCLRAASEIRARERMSGTMLHDVKGRMHAITLALDILKKTLLPGADARQLHYIESTKKDLALLQESVPALLPQTRRPDELSEVDLASLVSEVVRMMRVEAAMREVAFKVNTLESAVLRARPRELKHAFAAILLNVLHSIPEGRQIEIKLNREADWVRLTIIAPDALDRQTPADAIDVHVAREIVRSMGGDLYVDSARRCCFKLPLENVRGSG